MVLWTEIEWRWCTAGWEHVGGAWYSWMGEMDGYTMAALVVGRAELDKDTVRGAAVRERVG